MYVSFANTNVFILQYTCFLFTNIQIYAQQYAYFFFCRGFHYFTLDRKPSTILHCQFRLFILRFLANSTVYYHHNHHISRSSIFSENFHLLFPQIFKQELTSINHHRLSSLCIQQQLVVTVSITPSLQPTSLSSPLNNNQWFLKKQVIGKRNEIDEEKGIFREESKYDDFAPLKTIKSSSHVAYLRCPHKYLYNPNLILYYLKT